MRGLVTEKEVRKRRMLLLGKLVALSNGRTDTLIPTSEITNEVKAHFRRGYNHDPLGFQFFDVEPIEGRSSDMCYDLNMLLDEDIIKVDYLPYPESDREKGLERGLGVIVTSGGFQAHQEYNKHYFVKLFEKHPLTFIQWGMAAIGWFIGWWMGRQDFPWKR